MRKSSRLLQELASAARIESTDAANVERKFSWQRPKMPQRTRVLPSIFFWPFLTSIIEKMWKRLKNVRLPLKENSRGGTERPRYTIGASSAVPYLPSRPAHRRGVPPSLPCEPGIVSEHITLLIAPVCRLIVDDTTRFSYQLNAGSPT